MYKLPAEFLEIAFPLVFTHLMRYNDFVLPVKGARRTDSPRGGSVWTMKLTAKQIQQLVKQGEVVHTECKDASGGLPDSLWESYSSFANTDGGVILLGVKEIDNMFSIVGVPRAATLIKRFWDGVNNREKVSVNILFDRHVYSVKCRGRDVVVIEVPRADRQGTSRICWTGCVQRSISSQRRRRLQVFA